LIIAAIIDGLAKAHADNSSLFDSHTIEAYIEHWQNYDRKLTWKMKNEDLCYFLAELIEPFGENIKVIPWD
jgi:hypothetical protein